MAIKLIDILLEGIDLSTMEGIVDRVYPQIVNNLGKSFKATPKVEFHKNIYSRLSGIPGMEGEANPYAEYDSRSNKIYLYIPKMTDEEEIIKALLHEYTHATQDPKQNDEYRAKGYENNPNEIAARKAELDWKDYI
tara:strand:+ start:957 stop:1364 length:408 start_codon:yes stop_codon:yes gene_type:complete